MRSRLDIFIAVLWIVGLAGAVQLAPDSVALQAGSTQSESMPTFVLLMPAAFFVAISFYAPYSFFYHPVLARWINTRLGVSEVDRVRYLV